MVTSNRSNAFPLRDNPALREEGSALRRQVEKQFDIRFPDDYILFLSCHDGSSDFLGGFYVQFFAFEDLILDNQDIRTDEFYPGLVIFASNGGGEYWAFDKRTDPPRIVQIPAVGGISDALLCGHSFSEFLEYLDKGEFGPLIGES